MSITITSDTSTAISKLVLNGADAEVFFTSNPAKGYDFAVSYNRSFPSNDALAAFVTSGTSLGSRVNALRKLGVLQPKG